MTAEELLEALQGAPESVRRQMRELLAGPYAPQGMTPRPGLRVLANGVEVSKTAGGQTVGLPAGQSRFNVLNFLDGTLHVDSAVNGQQLNYTAPAAAANTDSFIVATAPGDLTAYRLLVAGAGLVAVDGGATANFSLALTSNQQQRGVVCAINGGGAAIPAGQQAYFPLPLNMTVTGWDLLCDASDTFTLDVQKTTYANFPASFATIWATAPAVSAAQKNQARSLSIAATQYDIWLFTISAGTPVSKKISLAVYGTAT